MDNSTTQKPKLTGSDFATRRAQVAAIKQAILNEGQPELHSDSTALCAHHKLRRGLVGGDQAEAQVTTHAAGMVIRFWVYGQDFSVKTRDLTVLATGDKGVELWLEADDKLFPHEGKYSLPARLIVAALQAKR